MDTTQRRNCRSVEVEHARNDLPDTIRRTQRLVLDTSVAATEEPKEIMKMPPKVRTLLRLAPLLLLAPVPSACLITGETMLVLILDSPPAPDTSSEIVGEPITTKIEVIGI